MSICIIREISVDERLLAVSYKVDNDYYFLSIDVDLTQDILIKDNIVNAIQDHELSRGQVTTKIIFPDLSVR
jgi:hypothetical protein